MSRKRTHTTPLPRRHVAESVAAPERTTVAEAGVAEASRERPGRLLVRLIKAGWSLNGNYYPAEVLKRDGTKAWPKGTQSFIDHATETEDFERPAGSVAKLAAIQTEDARWDEDSKSLVAWTRPLEPWKTPLMDMAKAEAEEGIPVIGMSIRAYVTAEAGEREGRRGNIVNSIEQGRSVDFVTRPAAGGAILDVLESMQAGQVAEARSIGTFLESRLHLALTEFADGMYGDGRLTRPERIVLSAAIGDGLGAYTARIEADAPQLYQRSPYEDAPDGKVAADEALSDDTRSRLQRAITAAHGKDDNEEEYGGPWVHDFDPDEAFVIYGATGKTWRQSYTTGESGLQLSGDRVEVARRTSYVPVDTPAAEAAPVIPPELLAVTETAAVLDRAAKALQNSPGSHPVTASADGSPSTAPTTPVTEGVSTMSGTTNEGVQPAAGTPNGAAVDEAVAFVAKQRDDAVNQLAAITEALTDARSAERTAIAERDQAVARALLLEGNEAGRIAVDRALADPAHGVPESMYASISPRVHTAVRGNVPMKESKVDAEALEALVASAIKSERTYAAAVLESQGVGRPTGLGGSGDSEVMSEADFEDQVAAKFRSMNLSESTATLAAKGR